MRARLSFLLLLAVMLAPIVGARAQSIQSPVIEKEFRAKEAERRSGRDVPLALPEFGGGGGDERQGERLFVLKHVRVVGAHSINPGDIRKVYAPFVGRSVSKADLGRISADITQLYKARGYSLSRAFVPPQDIVDGALTIRIVEGYIAEVAIDGLSRDWVLARRMLAPLTQERPARQETIERGMLLVSDLPGVRITDATLTELGTGSGRFKLTVKATFSAFVASIDFDNRGSRDIGPWQNFSTIAGNSLLMNGDTAIFNYSTTPGDPRVLGYYGGTYEVPLGSSGMRLGLRGSYSDVWPAGVRRDSDVRTLSTDYSAYVTTVLLRSRALTIRLTGSVGGRDVVEDTSSGPNYEDHVRAVAGAAEVQFQDAWGGSNYLLVSLRQGLSLDSSSQAGSNSSRPDANSAFQKVSFYYAHVRPIAGAWSLMAAATGQLASGPLLKSESIFAGGSVFGRAFAPGAVYGDNGLAGLVEVRYDATIPRLPIKGVQLYGFVDRAALWFEEADVRQQITSAGLGARFFLTEDTRAGIEIATPIRQGTDSGIDDGTRVIVSFSRALRGCERLWCN